MFLYGFADKWLQILNTISLWFGLFRRCAISSAVSGVLFFVSSNFRMSLWRLIISSAPFLPAAAPG